MIITPLDDQQLIGPSELGKLIGRSTKSIKLDVSRRPDTLPPRFQIPGTRKIQWRVADVRAWMEALAELQAQQRLAARQLAKKTGSTEPLPLRPFHLGEKHRGLAATEHMRKDEDAA